MANPVRPKPNRSSLGKSAIRLLIDLAAGPAGSEAAASDEGRRLLADDLAVCLPDGRLQITRAGRAWLVRAMPALSPGIDPFLGQHLALSIRAAEVPGGYASVLVDDGESPLVWLARRKGKDGRALIAPHQLLAGERLRSDFTCGHVMPRTTSNWDLSVSRERRSGGRGPAFSEASIAAQQRLRHALDAVGPEFSGLLLDICCFLKGLEDVERERRWPRSSAKIVLQLGLDRLARHYGYGAEAIGRARAGLRNWVAENAECAGAT